MFQPDGPSFASGPIVFINDLVNSGPLPALELSMRFAAQRQQIIAHNVANLETPDFRPADVSVSDFRRSLGAAVEERRRSGSGESAPLPWRGTREIKALPDGGLALTPRHPSPGVLFHDRNNRDLEKTMQDMVENVGAFRVASDFFRTRLDLLRAAISQRP